MTHWKIQDFNSRSGWLLTPMWIRVGNRKHWMVITSMLVWASLTNRISKEVMAEKMFFYHYGDRKENENGESAPMSIQKVKFCIFISIIVAWTSSTNSYRGCHIRVYHLVIGWHTLECNIWFWVRPHSSITFGLGLNMWNHMKVLQSNVVQP